MTITQDNRIGYALNLNPDHILFVLPGLKVRQRARMTGTINMIRTKDGATFDYTGIGRDDLTLMGSITVSEERGAA